MANLILHTIIDGDRTAAALHVQWWTRFLSWRQQYGGSALVTIAALLVCCEPACAGSTSGPLANETFINSTYPGNNNGGAAAIYLGNDFSAGSMRGLIRFNLPSSLNERMIINAVNFTLTTVALADGPPIAATIYLQQLTEDWGQGNGAGIDPLSGDYTQGQVCAAGGATWNQPFCSGVSWANAGGTVNNTVSASAFALGTSGSAVTWSSIGGTGMASDVQGWINNPGSNYGWRLFSSTEITYGEVQSFGKTSQLNISFTCQAGFLETSGTCTTCTAAAQSACVTSQVGNTCIDSAPPSTSYFCACNNLAYVGTGTTSCVDKNECSPNQCVADGDVAAICTDHVAPDTGYSCTCSTGFIVSAGTCVPDDTIFVDGFE